MDKLGKTCQERYFTTENIDTIYKRLKEETDIYILPYLGEEMNYGMGEVCLEEKIEDNNTAYKFYTVDRASKFDYQEFHQVEGAIKHLVSYYEKMQMVSDSDQMLNIFFETLHLNKKGKMRIKRNSKAIKNI